MSRKWLIVTGISILAEIFLLLRVPSILGTIFVAFMFLIDGSDCPLRETLSMAAQKLRFADSVTRIGQLSRLLKSDGNLQLWTTPLGEFWMPDKSLSSEIGILAEQDLNIYGFGALGVRKGDVVIDCGADIGTFTRKALDMGASLVVAIDPDPQKVICLRRNFEQQASWAGKVKVLQMGVWNREELMPFYENTGSVVIAQGLSNEVIRLTTIDNLVAELGLPRVDFIKMDIEGAEIAALQGARLTLNRFKPRLAISTEHFADDGKKIPQTVGALAPDYTKECGPCTYFDGRIRPHVIYFH
jgi:FkbM family methyltransferase